jgi:hypothetical protein
VVNITAKWEMGKIILRGADKYSLGEWYWQVFLVTWLIIVGSGSDESIY